MASELPPTPPHDVVDWTVFVWKASIAAFFSVVRLVIRQEYGSAHSAFLVTFVSFGCALFAGNLAELFFHSHNEMWAKGIIALVALIAHDILQMVINFGKSLTKDDDLLLRIVLNIARAKGLDIDPIKEKLLK